VSASRHRAAAEVATSFDPERWVKDNPCVEAAAVGAGALLLAPLGT
jgi:hypothetical protein